MMARFIAAQISGRMDTPCMATQDAIDRLAAEWGRGRRNMLRVLHGMGSAALCDLLLVGWAKAPLKLATGRNRGEWLSLMGE